MVDFSKSEGHSLSKGDDKFAGEIDWSHLDVPVDVGSEAALQTALQHQQVEVHRVPVRVFGVSR